MSLSNLNNAANIKTFIVKCFPTELVRVEVTHSGFIKKVNYREYIHYISVEGGVPVEHTSVDTLALDHDWYHDRVNGVLYYYIQDELADIVVTFGFFFKTGDTEPLHVDVSDIDTPLVMYDGRMLETSFMQSIDDISNGTLAISSTTISLINNDGYYQTLARDEVSFKKSYIEVRIFYNNVTNNVVVFTGSIESASFRSKEVIIEAKDINKILQSTAKFTSIESEYVTDKSTYPSIPDEMVGKEIPFSLGRMTGVSMQKIPVALNVSLPTADGRYLVDSVADSWDQGVEDYKIIPVLNKSMSMGGVDPLGNLAPPETVRTRQFLTYRTVNSIKQTSKIRLYQNNVVDLNSDKTTADWYGFEVEIPVSDTKEYFVGQQCLWFSAHQWSTSSELFVENWGRQLNWHRVSYINEVNSRIRISPAFQQKIGRLYDASGWSHIYFSPFTVSFIDAGKNIYVLPFIINPTEVSNSNGKLNIMEIGRFGMGGGTYGYGYVKSDKKEWTVGGINVKTGSSNTTNNNTTELENIQFTCRIRTYDTNLSLGCMLHRTLLEAGYQTDGGINPVLAEGTNSFRHLDTKLGTTYWTLHTGMVDTYLELLQMMLSSVFGFMYVQANGKIGVRLFEKIPYASTVWDLSEDDIVMDSIISDFNCGGICTRLRSTNCTNDEFMVESTSSTKRLLHGDVPINNKYYFESKSIYQAKVMPRKFEYLSNAVRKFDFTVINNGYDILLGDRISVSFPQSNKWLGYHKQYDLFVTAVNKSLQGTTVTAIENIFPELP